MLMICAISLSVLSRGHADDSISDKWKALFEREPFIYTVPLVEKVSPVDGTYVKKAKKEGEIVPCRRCPDWVPNPGIWKLNLHKGAYRIINLGTGWKSIGTYIVSENRILFANDPSCIDGIGLYAWEMAEDKLQFEVIDDPCAIKLRAKNLTETEWESCMPPNIEAAITEHWNKPDGCE